MCTEKKFAPPALVPDGTRPALSTGSDGGGVPVPKWILCDDPPAVACGVDPVSQLDTQAHEAAPNADPRELGGVRAGPPSSSLVNDGQSGTRTPRRQWSRKEKRAFGRAMSFLTWALSHGYHVWHVVLTGSDQSDGRLLTYHAKLFRRRMAREFGLKLVFFQSRTSEGPSGVLHLLVGFQQPEPRFKVFNAWARLVWDELHGAFIVAQSGVGRFARGSITKEMAARYMAQYVSDQDEKLQHTSWAWWALPVNLGEGWQTLKKVARELSEKPCVTAGGLEFQTVTKDDLVHAWEALLRHGAAALGEIVLTVVDRQVVVVP